MTSSSTTSDSGLSARMADGDEQALAVLFSRHRDKLWRMVHFRLDPRLASRMDADDVLQEAWLAALRRLSSFREQDSVSAFLWLRLIVGQSMIDLYRAHLGAAVRSAGREVPIFNGTPAASSLCLSAHLLASQTSPSQAAMRAERSSALAAALDKMSELDREILMLRHFEELGNDEAAAVLDLNRTAASNRYVRALRRLHGILEELKPGDA